MKNKKPTVEKSLFLLMILWIALLCSACSVGEHQGKADSALIMTRRVYLWPNEQASPQEEEEDLVLLKERLELIFGEDYTLTEEEGHMILTYPQSYEEDMDTAELLEYFITEPTDLSVCYDGERGKYKTISRLETESDITLKKAEQASEGDASADSSAAEADTGAGTGSTDGLEIVFSDRVQEEIAAYLQEEGGDLYLINNDIYQGYDTNSIYYEGYRLYPNSDKEGLYDIYPGQNEHFDLQQLLIQEYGGEKLHYPYNYYVVDQDMVWQDINESKLVGINQCNEQDMAEDSYVFHYMLYDRLTNEEYESVEGIVKNRLDALDSSYAFANLENWGFAIKIGPEHLNDQIMDALIHDKTFTLRYGYHDLTLSAEEGRNIIEYDEEKQSIDLLLGDDTELKDLISGPGKTLYLMLDNLVIASLPITEDLSGNEFVFTEISMTGEADEKGSKKESGDKESQAGSYLKDYLNMILNYQYDMDYASIHLDTYYYGDYTSYKDRSHFGVSYTEEYDISGMQEVLQRICPQADIKANPYNRNLAIYLNQAADDTFFTKTLPMISRIYEGIDYEDSIYDSLTIYPYDTEKDERAWMTFTKQHDGEQMKENDGDYIRFSGYFYNGRIEQYKEELEDYIRQDHFFTQFIYDFDPYSGWNL